MTTRNVCVAVALTLLFAGVASSQKIPTGTLTGHVTDGKLPLPGVTVTVTSPNQQGARTATSTINGDYILELLPSGFYTVKFEIEGFETVETTVKLSGDVTSRVDAVMPQAVKLAEQVTVAGRYDTLSTTAVASTTHEASLIQLLPVTRDAQSYLYLSPATVQLLGARPNPQIAGALATESLYLVNGAPSSDNIWGYFLPLYIEDAIQETTTSLSNISAEYGRFTGGVVSVLTKSGGNDFHGSARLNLTNPKWTAPTPLTTGRVDELGKVWEGTLGGYILKDKLWFFLGGRTTSTSTMLQTYPPANVPVDQTERQNRYEGKLTLALSPSHRVIGSYLDVTDDYTNSNYPVTVYDPASLYSQSVPMEIKVLNYNGVLSNSLFLEAQWSYRKQIYHRGSLYTDIERGTPVWDDSTGVMFNSPYFCAACGGSPETRENSDAFLKASWFLSTASAGSHDLRIGADLFDNMRRSDNWQSGSGYFLDAVSVNIVGTGTSAKYYPVILPDYSYIEYYPIYERSKGNHFKTKSGFANDVWRLNGNLSFNIGVRYDKNDGTDESGTTVVKDSKWSPRLSVTWDPRGDGATQVALGYAQYVAGTDNNTANWATGAGEPATFYYLYEGPPINAGGNEVETHGALREVFDWISSIGGLHANPQLLIGANYPGYQTLIANDLRSPSTTQWTVGVTRRLGTRGLMRLDLIDKTWTDLYSGRTDMTAGHGEDPLGNAFDRAIIENDPNVRRHYQAVVLQGDYRVGERLRLGGNYTLSKLYGNDTGYVAPMNILNNLEAYPEYRDLKWYAPEGYLAGDRRHKLNLYASWDAVSTKAVALNVSVLQRVLSGQPYGAWGTVGVRPYVTNPGYVTPPKFSWYAFTAPDAYRTGTVNATDIAATLTFKVGKGIEAYVNPQIQNVLNRRAPMNVDSTVYTNRALPDNLALFNPFTEKPKECPQGTTCNLTDGYNWQKGPSFGKPMQPSDYQTPRTFMLNVGLRF
jgi:outer membrane receptor protein involved in Fe transport